VFEELASKATVVSIAEPGHTDALEFDDGKVMLGKHTSLADVNWQNLIERVGREQLTKLVDDSPLVCMVNWTMLPHMSDIWTHLDDEVLPKLTRRRRRLFIDLADPEKRTNEDILRALELVAQFQKHFDVVLGLNEKEGHEVGNNLGLNTKDRTPEGLTRLCQEIHLRVKVDTLIIHPTAYALASGPDGVSLVQGPFTPKPKITTGAGDHFNSGFCLGKLLGFPTEKCLLTGVTTSGLYVRTGNSPTVTDLAGMLRDWPV
jgi:hypothetical protein